MSDVTDRASDREAEIRDDALARQARAAEEQSAQPSAEFCQVCDEPIPAKRREKLPGVQTCVECQKDLEHRAKFTRRVE